MIKKLRMKLIAASMVSLLIVLLVIEGIVGILNYRKMAGDADRILEVFGENLLSAVVCVVIMMVNGNVLQEIPAIGYNMIWWNTIFGWGIGCIITWGHFLLPMAVCLVSDSLHIFSGKTKAFFAFF